MALLSPSWSGHWGIRRRVVQLGFLAVFAALPILDLFRFDFPAGRLRAFGKDLWLDEWALVWLGAMFGMWVIGAATLVLGRVWCAWACPQTVFTELAHDLDAVARRLARPVPKRLRERSARGISLVLVGGISVIASALFLGYFAPLPVVLSRLARFDLGPWVGAVGAATALVTFLDFGFVRERFCRHVCPYGLLQAVLEDGRSLHVRLDTATGPCTGCSACAKVCPMEIDIRNGPFQVECTRCGACVDACTKVLAAKKRPSILAFAFGGGKTLDAKRVLVASATAAFGLAFAVVLLTRQEISLRVSPVYTADGMADAEATSRFLLRVRNRRATPVELIVSAVGLPDGAVVIPGNARLPAGAEARVPIAVSLPRSSAPAGPVPFTLRFDAAGSVTDAAVVFYSPKRRPT
jgi:polyferredoxin